MDTTETSFKFASESSKLLITLSTGVIAFMIAFLDKDSSMKPASGSEKFILLFSWLIFLTSAIVGIWTQLAITDELEPETKPNPFQPTIRSNRIKIPFRIQALSFMLGVIMTVIYGFIRIL